MKSLVKHFLVMLLLAIVFSYSAGLLGTTDIASANTGVKWYSYKAGLEKMKKDGKMGYLHFYTNWCIYCKMMKKQTFSNKKVADYLNRNFIPIEVNAEQQQSIARKYDVNAFPENWFLSPDGTAIANRPGFIAPGLMFTILEYLHSGSYKTVSFQDYMHKHK